MSWIHDFGVAPKRMVMAKDTMRKDRGAMELRDP